MGDEPNVRLKLRAAQSSPKPSLCLSGLCFFAVFLLGMVARWHGITSKPLWMDEVTTIQRASLPLGRMVANSLTFHQFPSYFVITSWMLPLGTSEAWVRLPAALFGALSCALGFGVARALGGTRAGLATGLLLALSPAQVQYGQEARSYTLLISAVLVALWGLLLLAQDPLGASRPVRAADGRPGAWAAYTLGTAAALNVLGVALVWLAAANAAAVALGRQRTGSPVGFRRNWLLAHLVIALLCVPWFVALDLFGQRGVMGGLDWVPSLTRARLWWALDGAYLMQVTSLITVRVFADGVPGLGLAVLALAIGGAFTLRRRGAPLAVLGAATLVLPLSLLAISIAGKPVWMPRYLLWSAAPFFIFAGLGTTLLPRRLQGPVVAVLGLLCALNLRPYYHRETKPRWDLAAFELQAGLQPGDLVLMDDPQAVGMMNIYLARTGAPLPTGVWTTDVQQAAAWLARGRRVWAVQGPVGQADRETQAQFLRRIGFLGAPDLTEQAGLDVRVMRFDGTGSSDMAE